MQLDSLASATTRQHDAGHEILDWQQLLPFAQARNAARGSADLPWQMSGDLTDSVSLDTMHASICSLRSSSDTTSSDSQLAPTPSRNDHSVNMADELESETERTFAQPDDSATFSFQLVDNAATSLGEKRIVAASLNRENLGSAGLSFIAHAALLVVLGMFTYRPDSTSASLGSQVMELQTVSADVELSAETQVSEPVELDVIEPTNQTDIATKLEAAATRMDALDALENTSSASTSAMSNLFSSSASPVESTSSRLSSAIVSSSQSSSGASRGASGSSGPPQLGGKFFGVGSGGNYFCYVVDSSGSMRGGAWESAKVELVRSLSTLTPSQRFYIVFFAQEFAAIPEPGEKEPAKFGLYATPENIDHARRWIDTVKLDRGGPPNDALQWAIEREPDAIYLLTDGVTKVDVCGFLRKKNRTEDLIGGVQVRVPIHAIAYFSLDGQQLMRQLAEENAGQFHYVPPKRK